jgi:transcriptional regulator GlxA family with amidase domain
MAVTDALMRALRFMKEHFYEKLTLADVAGQAGLSADYFGRIFHSELKLSFSEYLTRLRVEEGKRLLQTSQASLGDIAYACGFEDQSYFTRVFRKTVGVTPSRYRSGDSVID